MELDTCLMRKRSIRKFEDKSVPKTVIDKLLEAGVWAPSGMNSQPFQTAFKNWPLYHYSKDMKPGDVNGNGFRGIWFVVDPMKFPPK